MIKREYQSEKLDERYVEAIHDSGCRILVCEKPEFTGAYAMFGTRYGSIDNCFKQKGEAEFTQVPAGIAHFLEHKLFESEDGDAFSRYAKTGASANAYTSFDRTCYLFSCNDHFEDSLRILLDFVQTPYFTEQTVQKEQGIIGQEISMYDDSPDWVLLFNLFTAMYRDNPIRINVAGTQQSISEITAELLYRCYDTFYNLQNMFLVVAGNVQADRVLDIAQELLKKKEPVEVIRKAYDEPENVLEKRTEATMSVSQPQFAIGYKESMAQPMFSVRDKIETDMLVDLIAGKQSPLYKRLLDEGLINQQFSAGLFDGYQYALELFSGESRDPDRVAEEIAKEIERLRREGIDQEDFERLKKSYYGRYLMTFNSVENIADQLVDCAYAGRGLFDDVEVYSTMTKQALEERLQKQLCAQRCSLSVIRPVE